MGQKSDRYNTTSHICMDSDVGPRSKCRIMISHRDFPSWFSAWIVDPGARGLEARACVLETRMQGPGSWKQGPGSWKQGQRPPHTQFKEVRMQKTVQRGSNLNSNRLSASSAMEASKSKQQYLQVSRPTIALLSPRYRLVSLSPDFRLAFASPSPGQRLT